MIIFSLDGVLADCEHRRHLVDWHKTDYSIPYCNWQPDYQAYNEACDKDEVVEPIAVVLRRFEREREIQIWSDRPESLRQKTLDWIFYSGIAFPNNITLKLRPIGDTTPEHQLKEKWLDENIEMINGKRHCRNQGCNHYKCGNPIDFVFESDPKSIEMWKRRGVFVFDVNQGRE